MICKALWERKLLVLILSLPAIFVSCGQPTILTFSTGSISSCGPSDAPQMRRLSGFEYQNALKDLFGSTVTVSLGDLPRDETNEYGFYDGSSLAIGTDDVQKYLDVSYSALAPLFTSAVPSAFYCTGAKPSDLTDKACARAGVERFLNKALRGTVETENVDQFIALLSKGKTLQEGYLIATMSFVDSPLFLFTTAAPDLPVNTSYTVSANGVMETLALTLWASIPDDELMAAAKNGDLATEDGVSKQVNRMIADVKFERAAEQFFSNMFQLDKMDAVSRDAKLFPEFNTDLVGDMRKETLEFLKDIVHSNAPVTEILTAHRTFLNQRLAAHYGITGGGADNATFKKVDLPADGKRVGVLTQGSIAVLTTRSTQETNPIVRGHYVLDLLCRQPPPPPPSIPALPTTDDSGKVLTVKERLATHRTNQTCAACHAAMDPYGVVLEAINPDGKVRTKYETTQNVVDDTDMYGQVLLSGPNELISSIEGSGDFETCFTKKLASYMVSRPLDAGSTADRCEVKFVLGRSGGSKNASFKEIVLSVLQSELARFRVVKE